MTGERVVTGERSAVIALGSNLGDREATIRAAVDAIAALDGVRLTGVSSLRETVAVRPHGLDESAPRYLNGVVTVATTLEPEQLLAALHGVEARFGRVRAERWGDRTLDLDLVALGDERRDDERIVLPHPRAAEREFVLAPWLEIDPRAVLPGAGPVAALLSRLREAS